MKDFRAIIYGMYEETQDEAIFPIFESLVEGTYQVGDCKGLGFEHEPLNEAQGPGIREIKIVKSSKSKYGKVVSLKWGNFEYHYVSDEMDTEALFKQLSGMLRHQGQGQIRKWVDAHTTIVAKEKLNEEEVQEGSSDLNEGNKEVNWEDSAGEVGYDSITGLKLACHLDANVDADGSWYTGDLDIYVDDTGMSVRPYEDDAEIPEKTMKIDKSWDVKTLVSKVSKFVRDYAKKNNLDAGDWKPNKGLIKDLVLNEMNEGMRSLPEDDTIVLYKGKKHIVAGTETEQGDSIVFLVGKDKKCKSIGLKDFWKLKTTEEKDGEFDAVRKCSAYLAPLENLCNESTQTSNIPAKTLSMTVCLKPEDRIDEELSDEFVGKAFEFKDGIFVVTDIIKGIFYLLGPDDEMYQISAEDFEKEVIREYVEDEANESLNTRVARRVSKKRW